MYFEKDKQLDTKPIVDAIEKAVYAEVKPLGFKKHGRTLHRFVDGDISQVIKFRWDAPPRACTTCCGCISGSAFPNVRSGALPPRRA